MPYYRATSSAGTEAGMNRLYYGDNLAVLRQSKTVNPSMVRDLVGTVKSPGDEMGLLITLSEPTRGMIEEVNRSGTYDSDFAHRRPHSDHHDRGAARRQATQSASGAPALHRCEASTTAGRRADLTGRVAELRSSSSERRPRANPMG